jgi:hypothetical protein
VNLRGETQKQRDRDRDKEPDSGKLDPQRKRAPQEPSTTTRRGGKQPARNSARSRATPNANRLSRLERLVVYPLRTLDRLRGLLVYPAVILRKVGRLLVKLWRVLRVKALKRLSRRLLEALFLGGVLILKALGGLRVFNFGLGGSVPRNNRPIRRRYKEEDLRIGSDLRAGGRLLRDDKPMKRLLVPLDPLRRGPQPSRANSSDGLTGANALISADDQPPREPTGGLLRRRGGCVIRLKHTPTDREPGRPAKDFLHGRPRWVDIATRPSAPGSGSARFAPVHARVSS